MVERMCEFCKAKEAKKKYTFLTLNADSLTFEWYCCSFNCALQIAYRQVSVHKHIVLGKEKKRK